MTCARWPWLALLLAGVGLAPGSGAAAADGGREVQLAAQHGPGSLVCHEIEQRHLVNRHQTNARVLNFLLFDAAENGCRELAERFLELGASVTARDRFGNTALLLAARMGEDEVVGLLLERGSEIAHRNLAGSTALLRAVTMNRRRTAGLLLDAGADPGAANNQGVTPLLAAVFNGNQRLTRMLLDAGADPAAVDATGKGPLVYAAAKGFTRIAALLLEVGTDVNRRYGNDLTALMWAAGYSNDVPPAEGLETVKLLLDRGARHDLADDRGRTALMIAAERGHAAVVALLLAAGAEPGRRDRQGKTARDLAQSDAVRRVLATP